LKLILVRHAEAVERGTPDVPDEERPLTPRGEKRFRKAARGLARLARRPDLLLTSPLPRARRTAEIAGRAWGGVDPVNAEALARGDFDALAPRLPGRGTDRVVVLVGHEPHLSSFLARLLGAEETSGFAFRKGGAAMVDVLQPPLGEAHLVWFLPPKLLRRLGKG
jgi:phosphohistidine phosphatase